MSGQRWITAIFGEHVVVPYKIVQFGGHVLNMEAVTLGKPVELHLSHLCSWKERDGKDSLKFPHVPHIFRAGKRNSI